MKNKVLIVSNPLNHEGGIVNYYNLYFKYFASNDFELKHFTIGSRAFLFYRPFLKKILYPVYYFFDYFRFVITLLLDTQIKIIQLNPSLIPVPLIRDGLLLFTAKLFGKKVIVFYRGWKLQVFSKLHSNEFLKKMFNWLYQKGTQQIVLASSFKSDLLKLGEPTLPIIITTTAIDKSEIVIKEKGTDKRLNILFLGRIQNLKGIEEIVDAIIQLKDENKLKYFRFTFVGHESRVGYIQSLQEKLSQNQIYDDQVSFKGRITGQEKYEIYALHDIYLLPSYTEGCPNSVLEALASGLFCITTNVGALNDIIKNGKNGVLIQKKSNADIVNALLYCQSNKEVLNSRIENAILYSNEFDIRKIIFDFNNIYSQLTYAK